MFLGPIGPLELGLSVGWSVGSLSRKSSLRLFDSDKMKMTEIF